MIGVNSEVGWRGYMTNGELHDEWRDILGSGRMVGYMIWRSA